MARVAMNGTIPPYAMSTPLTRPQPRPTRTAVKRIAGEAVLLGGDGGGPHRGEGDDRADRQVDAAGDDDEGHADGDDADDGRLGEDQLEVAGVQELVRLGEAADQDQYGEHAEQGQGAHVGAEQHGPPGGLFVTGGTLGVLSRGGETFCVMTPGFLP